MGSYLNQSKNSRRMTGVFTGLDRRERISDGAWSDMLNMTAAKYPCAASRNRRATQLFTENVTVDGVTEKRRASGEYQILDADILNGELNIIEVKIQKDAVFSPYYIRFRNGSGATQYVKGGYITNNLLTSGIGAFEKWGILHSGRDIFIYPGLFHTDYERDKDEAEKKLYSVKESAGGSSEWNKISMSPVDEDGAAVSVTSSASAPVNPVNGAYWYDTVSKGMYRYSAASSEWTACPTGYMKITCESKLNPSYKTFANLKEGDAVDVFVTDGTNAVVSSHIVHSVSGDGNGIVITGYINGITDITEINITRKAPFLQHACAWRNRIWGCCYGEHDGEFLNEIYGSALGDMSNFFKYEGTAADSYTVSVGTGGRFTGIAQLEDSVVFFKEDRYYVLTGGEPPFSLNEYSGAGIQDGSAKSAVVINGYVYYKSYGGIMRMSPDSRPVRVSDALGTDKWEDAIAGTDGERYIVSMKRIGSSERELFVYDTLTGLWTQEENPFVSPPAAILRYRNNAFAIGSVPADSVEQVGTTTAAGIYTPVIQYFDGENVNRLTVTNLGGWSSEAAAAESTVEWHADTGVMGLEDPNNKFIKQIQVRGRLGSNARIGIEISYDGHSEDREQLYTEENELIGTFNAVYAPPVRCDNFRLHFSGVGEVVIFSITVTTEEANDCVQR